MNFKPNKHELKMSLRRCFKEGWEIFKKGQKKSKSKFQKHQDIMKKEIKSNFKKGQKKSKSKFQKHLDKLVLKNCVQFIRKYNHLFAQYEYDKCEYLLVTYVKNTIHN